ncbi:hypothetical protein J6590_041188 [Homalodisca vitripennis]|nr:hypothetical protein J6590_094915 [Homalodisca vitripennis]KAG8321736.1 hypothetical protein J6590_041188 [Homalodisca vitripennis]
MVVNQPLAISCVPRSRVKTKRSDHTNPELRGFCLIATATRHRSANRQMEQSSSRNSPLIRQLHGGTRAQPGQPRTNTLQCVDFVRVLLEYKVVSAGYTMRETVLIGIAHPPSDSLSEDTGCGV